MASRWIPEFVVWRLTDIGPLRLRTFTLASALYWAAHLRRRWNEQVWIERAEAPAHQAGLRVVVEERR